MGGIVYSLQNKIRLARLSIASILTPPAGEIRIGADNLSGHIVQVDSAGKVIDLAAVGSQEDTVGFDDTITWRFDSTDEGWTVANGTIAFDSANGKGLLISDTSATLTVIAVSPSGLTIDGNLYRRVKASVTLVSGSLPDDATVPTLRYHTAGHGSSPSFAKTLSYPPSFQAIGDTAVLDFDMETATGTPDWYAPPNNVITQLRLLLTDAVPADTVFRINWVSVGRNMPAKKSAGAGTTVTGTSSIDFTGTNNAKVTVTGQAWVTATSTINAAVRPNATAEHSVDEHIILSSMLGLSVPIASIVPGVGFDIVGVANTSGVIGGTVNVQWIGVP